MENQIKKFLKNAFAKSIQSPFDIARKSIVLDPSFMPKLWVNYKIKSNSLKISSSASPGLTSQVSLLAKHFSFSQSNSVFDAKSQFSTSKGSLIHLASPNAKIYAASIALSIELHRMIQLRNFHRSYSSLRLTISQSDKFKSISYCSQSVSLPNRPQFLHRKFSLLSIWPNFPIHSTLLVLTRLEYIVPANIETHVLRFLVALLRTKNARLNLQIFKSSTSRHLIFILLTAIMYST
jgi:hypothetical protein